MAGVEPGTGQKTGEGKLSWPVFLLTLAAITSSSLSALSLYQLVALRAEVEGLKSEVYRRREEGRETKHADQVRVLKYILIRIIFYIYFFFVHREQPYIGLSFCNVSQALMWCSPVPQNKILHE